MRTLFLMAFLAPFFIYSTEKSKTGLNFKGNKIYIKNLDDGTQVTVFEGKFVATNEDMKATADYAEYNLKTDQAFLKGNVVITRDDIKWFGPEIRGKLKAKTFEFDDYLMQKAPWFVKGKSGNRDKDGINYLKYSKLTTCDVRVQKIPHWHIGANSVMLNREGDYKAKHVTFRILNIPVFYLPYLSGNVNDDPNLELSQGKKTDWGYWIRIGKKVRHSKNFTAKYFVEYREERGWAIGDKIEYKNDKFLSDTLLYGLKDSDPIYEGMIGGRGFNDRFYVEDNRFRIKSYNRYDFDDSTALRANFDYISDHRMLFEFFEREYNQNPEPGTFITVSKDYERLYMTLGVNPRVNDFTTVIERTPEFYLRLPRQQIKETGIYYQGDVNLAKMRMNFREYDLARPVSDNEDYENNRADMTHVFYKPIKLDWLNILPRAGLRFTAYDITSETPVTESELISNISADNRFNKASNTAPVTLYDDDGDGKFRSLAEFGLELSFHVTGSWRDVNSDFLRIKGLKHNMKPYLNYTYITDPDVEKENIPFFDEVDRMDQVNHVRVGVRHDLFTRADANFSQSFLTLDTFYDHYFRTDELDDDESPGDLGAVLRYNPDRRFSLWAKTLYDLEESRNKVLSGGIRLGDPKDVNVSLRYLHQAEHKDRYFYSFGSDHTRIYTTSVFPGVNTRNRSLGLGINVPLTNSLVFRADYHWDLIRDELGSQRYRLVRHLQCWAYAVQFSQNDEESKVQLTIWLKGVPGVRISQGSTIGESTTR